MRSDPAAAAAGGPVEDVAPPGDDRELLDALPSDPSAFATLYDRHANVVYGLALAVLRDAGEAEDLTQEVFVRVFRSLSQYTPGTFEGWLHRITTNLFLDQVRRKARIRFEGLPEDAADRLASREVWPQQLLDDRTYDADIQAALDALPPDFRVAVVLCDIEGLTYEEISELLGIKLGTVRSRIHRGRAALRDSLAHRTPRTASRLPSSDVEQGAGLS